MLPINPQGFEFSVEKDTTSPAGITASILPLAVVGFCTDLAIAEPTPFATPGAIEESAGEGIGAECGCYLLGSEGQVGLIHLINPGSATDGAYGSITTSLDGASTITIEGDADTLPSDHLLPKVRFTVGGNIAAAGIKFEASIDNGYSYFSPIALGTSNVIDLSQYGAGKYNIVAPIATLIARANDIATKLNAHAGGTGTYHGSADGAAPYTFTTATNDATLFTLCGELKVNGAAHVVKTTGAPAIHGAADTTAQTIIAALSAPTTRYGAQVFLEAFALALFGDGTANSGHTRRTAGSVHGAQDTTNTLAALGSLGVVTTNDSFSLETTAPAPDATQYQTAIRSLRDYNGLKGQILFSQPITGALVDVIKAEIVDLWKYNVFLDVIWSARVPNAGETVTQYSTYLDTEFGAYHFQDARLCSGGTYVYSGRYTAATGRVRPLRPRGWSIAQLSSTTEPQTLLSAVPAPQGVFIKDSNGKTLARCFDESSGNLFSVQNRTVGTRTRKDKNDNDGVHAVQDITLYPPNSDWVMGPYSEVVTHLIRVLVPIMAAASEAPEGYDAPPVGPLPDEVRQRVEATANAVALKNGKEEGRCHQAIVTITDTSNATIKWQLRVVPNFYAFNGAQLKVNVSQTVLVREVG